MDIDIKFEGEKEQEYSPNEIIKIKRVREIRGLDDLVTDFKKELQQIALEDIMDADVSLEAVIKKIQVARPNMLVLKKDFHGNRTYVVVETEIFLGDYILTRNKKMIASGSLEDVQVAFIWRINKEFSGAYGKFKPDEIDSSWIEQFNKMRYGGKNTYKIIKI